MTSLSRSPHDRSKLQELRAVGDLTIGEARQLREFRMPQPDATPVTQVLIGWGKAAALHMNVVFKVWAVSTASACTGIQSRMTAVVQALWAPPLQALCHGIYVRDVHDCQSAGAVSITERSGGAGNAVLMFEPLSVS